MALVTSSYCFFFNWFFFLISLIDDDFFLRKKRFYDFFSFLFIGLPQFHDLERGFGELTRVGSHLFFLSFNYCFYVIAFILLYPLIFDLLRIDIYDFFISGASDHGLPSIFFVLPLLSHNLTFIFFLKKKNRLCGVLCFPFYIVIPVS